MKKTLATLVAAFLAFATILVGAAGTASAQDQAAVNTLSAHSLDSRDSTVVMSLVADTYDIEPGTVTVVENGASRTVSDVQSGTAAGVPLEVMFVIDTRVQMSQGNAIDKAKTAVIEAVAELPEGSRAGIVTAGDTAVVVEALTSDREALRAAVDDINLSTGGAILDGIISASNQFEDRVTGADDRSLFTEAMRSIVVVSGGEDESSTRVGSVAAREALTSGAVVFAVRYAGGESELRDIVAQTRGFSLGAQSADDISTSLGTIMPAASDRLLVTFEGSGDTSARSDLIVDAGGATAAFSFAYGSFIDSPNRLIPTPTGQLSGPSFLRSSSGLYISIILAFVAVAAMVWASANIFFSGDLTLDSMLERYANEGDSANMSDEETSIVQTALVQRAVALTESFAEDRGLLVKIEDLLDQASLPLRPGEAITFWIAGVFAGLVLGFVLLGGLFGALMLAMITGLLLVFFVRFKGKRRRKQFEQQLPDMLQLLAGTLRAGYSLPQGLDAVSHEIDDPMGYEIRRVMTEANLGRELEDALGTTADRMGSPDFAWAVMAIGIQREVGGNLNELLMTVADTMIARERLRGEVAALTAEGKMTAILLGGLPPGLGFVMWVMNPDYINKLFTTGLGKALLVAGVVSMAVGMAWMKKVMTVDA